MELIVRFDGREETVRLEHTEAGWRVQVGTGPVREVDVALLAELGHGTELLSLVAEGRQAEVALRPTADGIWVSGAEGTGLAEVVDPLADYAKKAHGGGGAGKRVVKAYMPGRVVALLAIEGDIVEVGQGVVVLEAMKMENEIPAETSGSLVKIFVAIGTAVDAGDPLFEVA
jgi:biotin carboxyl carrier protein